MEQPFLGGHVFRLLNEIFLNPPSVWLVVAQLDDLLMSYTGLCYRYSTVCCAGHATYAAFRFVVGSLNSSLHK